MILDRFRCFAGLAWDAAEALLYSLNSNRVADVLWASARTAAAHRLVEKEAQEEVAEATTTFYYVPGMMYPYWAVTAEKAANLDSDTDMGDLSVSEFTESFLPQARRIPKNIAWDRLGPEYLEIPRSPAGGEAPNPPAGAPPSQTFPTAGQPTSQCNLYHYGRTGFQCTKPLGHDGEHGYAGVFWADPQPNLTSSDFYNASYAVRQYSDGKPFQWGVDWRDLSQRLSNKAAAMGAVPKA